MDNLHKLTVTINGKKQPFFLKDIVKFLYETDAQMGKLEESGMEHLMKDKIEIEENGNFFWSPLPASEVSAKMDNFRKNRLLLKESKTIKQTQDNLKKNFIIQNSCVGNINRFWCILDLYSIDEYVKKIFEKTDKNRYSNIFNRYATKAKSQNLDVWNVPILLEYIAELIFINKDILTKWDSIIK